MPRKKTHKITDVTIALLLSFSFVAGGLGGAISTQILSHLQPKVSPHTNKTPPINNEVENLPCEKSTEIITQKEIIEKKYVEESSIISTVKKVSPAVVSVVVTKDLPLYRQNFYYDPFEDFFNDQFFALPQYKQPIPQHYQQPQTEKQKVGGGTGFIFSQDGLVITNKHVVEDETAEYTVILNDGKEHRAEVLGLDPLNDLAVLQIKAEEEEETEFSYITLGDSDELQVGQKVVAIGNALAEYENTVTSGVISAKNRSIVAGDQRHGTEALNNLLQTDAAINPGNSGGPLVNLSGEVIGINTAIATNANGIGFAIPINDAKQVVESVQKYGRIIRPMLGIRYALLNEDSLKNASLHPDFEYNYGALIVGDALSGNYAVIPGSPADQAGLLQGDVILEVNGQTIETENILRDVISKSKIGDNLTLKVWRDGMVMSFEVKLGEI